MHSKELFPSLSIDDLYYTGHSLYYLEVRTDRFICDFQFSIRNEGSSDVVEKPDVHTVEACVYECSQTKPPASNYKPDVVNNYVHLRFDRHTPGSGMFDCVCGKFDENTRSKINPLSDVEKENIASNRACILMPTGE